MSRIALLLLLLMGAFVPELPGQILINEFHSRSGLAVPTLPGDFLELWNQSSSDYDLSGHTICLFISDFGSPICVRIPCSPAGRHIIPAHGFWIFQEPGGVLGNATTGRLINLPGMRGLPINSGSDLDLGIFLLAPTGQCLDYVYLRGAGGQQPQSAPNLPQTGSWTMGSFPQSNFRRNHFQRLTNTDTDQITDWANNPDTTFGTPGALNTILGASQTSTGPTGSIPSAQIAWQSNSPTSSLSINGLPSTGLGPITFNSTCRFDPVQIDLASTQVGLPFDIGVALNGAVSGNTFCAPGTGGLNTRGGQVLNLNLSDPTLFWINQLNFSTLYAANLSAPLSAVTPAIFQAQMLNLNPANADLFTLSAAIDYSATGSNGSSSSLPTFGSQVNVQVNSLCGIPSISFFGTTFTEFWCHPSGRVTFVQADGDTTATLAEARTSPPWVGFWTDLLVGATATSNWTVSNVGPVVSVTWTDAVYLGTNASASFQLDFDTATSDVTVQWGAVAPNPLANGGRAAQMLGLSGGFLRGATLGQSLPFESGLITTGALPSDMLYEFWDGRAASAPGGINRLATFGLSNGVLFSWNGTRYQAIGF